LPHPHPGPVNCSIRVARQLGVHVEKDKNHILTLGHAQK
jgi:hypothetical protein